MHYTRFPSPPACAAAVAAGRRPSPQGRGRMVLRLSITRVPEFGQQPSAKHPSDACCSLSLRERVRVRGKYSVEHGKCSISRGLLSMSDQLVGSVQFCLLRCERATIELLRRRVALGQGFEVIKRARTIEKFQLRSAHPRIGVEGRPIIQRETLVRLATEEEQVVYRRRV